MNEILKEVLKELKSLNNCKIDQRKFRVTLSVVHGLSHRASKFISPYPDNFIDMMRFVDMVTDSILTDLYKFTLTRDELISIKKLSKRLVKMIENPISEDNLDEVAIKNARKFFKKFSNDYGRYIGTSHLCFYYVNGNPDLRIMILLK